jgi:hypothetical protein
LRQFCDGQSAAIVEYASEDARTKIEAWRVHYNARRPHSSLGHLTPTVAGLVPSWWISPVVRLIVPKS